MHARCKEVADGSAVAGDESFESPLIAQDTVQIACLCTAGLAVDALIGTHNLLHVAFLYQRLEGWHIGLPQVALGQVLHIKLVAVPLRTAMHGIVLGAGIKLRILRLLSVDECRSAVVVVALQSAYHGQTHACGEVGVFAVGLLATSPTWITEDVDVRCPERQSAIAFHLAATLCLHVLGTGLVAHAGKHLVHQRIVERCRHSHGDRVDGGKTVAAHTVQGFVPPFKLRDAQPFDFG